MIIFWIKQNTFGAVQGSGPKWIYAGKDEQTDFDGRYDVSDKAKAKKDVFLF